MLFRSHIIPLISYILHIIDLSNFILIMSHQIIPVPILIYIINDRNEIEHPKIEKRYKDDKNKLKEDKKEIDEIENPLLEIKIFDMCLLSIILTLDIFSFSNKKIGSELPGPKGQSLLISTLKLLLKLLEDIFDS